MDENIQIDPNVQEIIENRGEEERKTTIDSLRTVISDDREKKQKSLTFSQVIAGDILAKGWFLRQKWVFVEILIFALMFISIRFSVQEDILEIDRLETIHEMEKNKAMTSSSQLTELSRQSKIEETLKSIGDSTLTAPDTPPIKISTNNSKEGE